MVERIALRLWMQEMKGPGEDEYLRQPREILRYWRDAARIAIEAMRQPTEAMLAAARDPVWDFSPDYAPSDPDPRGERDGSAEEVGGRAYRAMIDAALKAPVT